MKRFLIFFLIFSPLRKLATCLITGVLPFGSNNNFATRIFPKRELEVERYCEASMAIIANK